MGFMFITINGHLGSGKSTVCAILRDNYGFRIFSAGSIQREFANRLNISTLELNKKSFKDLSFDYYIDNATVEYAKLHYGESVIFDSRLAWYFVPNSFKVHLTIDAEIAATRVFIHRQSEEEHYSTVNEAILRLSERQNTETERYRSIYGIEINDSNNYDYIIDTSNLTSSEVAERIMFKYKQFIGNCIKQSTIDYTSQNCFINRKLAGRVFFYNDTATIITIDNLIENILFTVKNSYKNNSKAKYFNTKLLVINDFQNCSGKEATQKVVLELIFHRIKENLPTHLICTSDFSHLKSISEELYKTVNDNFSFIP